MIRFAFANLLHRKLRTLLGVAGVAVQVALVLVLVGITTGTLEEAGERIENVGSDILVLPPGAQLMLAMSTAIMPLEPARRALEATEGVLAVAPVAIATTNRFGAYGMIFGIEPQSYIRSGRGALEIIEGRAMTGPDDLLVDRRLARAHDLRVGQTIDLLNHPFTLAGIVRDGAGVRLYLPIASLQDLLGRIGKASLFFVRSRDPEATAEVVDRLRANPAFKGYTILPAQRYGELLGASTYGIREFIAAVTAVAVSFGFLVVALAMYTAVLERTRQIGILQSLGADRGFVVAAVLVEATLLCAAGIPAGFALALSARLVLASAYPTLVVSLTSRWFLYTALLALGGGLLGAVYPAFRAARFDPVTALGWD